ncbi:hypothetical protein, partial [Pseudomonas viridiflava]|uniref:hypothetical protein n=1 Tax=Pseudomonas viridiflava TaxID=33069 RepID=UPI0013DF8FA5
MFKFTLAVDWVKRIADPGQMIAYSALQIVVASELNQALRLDNPSLAFTFPNSLKHIIQPASASKFITFTNRPDLHNGIARQGLCFQIPQQPQAGLQPRIQLEAGNHRRNGIGIGLKKW